MLKKHQGFLRPFVLSEASILIHQISPKFLTSWLWKVSRLLKNLALGKKTGNNKFWENFPGGEISNLYISKWKTLIFSKASEPVGDLTVKPQKRWGIDNLKSVLMRFGPKSNHSSRTQTSPSLSQLGKCESQLLLKIVLLGIELRSVSNKNTWTSHLSDMGC